MLNRAISQSKKMSELSDDTSRLLFTWAIPHLDRDGRMKADPSLFKSIVCPRLEIDTDKVAEFLQEWHDVGAIIWYDSDDGDKYLFCIGWKRQQIGLRYEREAASRCPAPPPELLRSKSATSPHNGMERNRIEKGSADAGTALNGGPASAGDLMKEVISQVEGKGK